MRIGAMVICAAMAAGSASAGTISGNGSPTDALVGGTVLSFDLDPAGVYTSYSTGGVTFSHGGYSLYLDSSYAGNYNVTGQSIHNVYDGSADVFRFDFATAVDGFAFNWGASDVSWTLAAFDAGGTLLGSAAFSPTTGSNAGEYIGLAYDDIAYATLLGGQGNDYIFIDNFTTVGDIVAPVPLPATLPLLLAGLAGIAALRRRKLA